MTTPKLSALVLALALALGLGAAQTGPARVAQPARAVRHERSDAPEVAQEAAERLASQFMTQLLARRYRAQWGELAPLAQALWPSEQARDTMLAAKFQGAASPISFRLGRLRREAGWTSPEDPGASVGGVYEIPVSLTFADPSKVGPPGVVADYQSSGLVVARTRLLLGPQLLPRGGQVFGLRLVGEGPAAVDSPIITPAHAPAETASVPIVMYHLVGPFPVRAAYASVYSYDIDYELTVTPAQFQGEIGYLVAQGYTAISLDRLMDHLDYGLPLPPRAVILTFDDGFLSEYQYAVPVLRRAGFTATFFPCSGLIGITNGHEAYMTAADLRQLSQGGFAIEDHTYNDGTSLWSRSQAQIDYLAGSTASQLEAITGQPIQFIAYSGLWPYRSGTQVGPGERQLFSELAPLGYVGGLEDDWLPGSPWQESGAQPWELPRLRAWPNESLASYASVLAYG